MRKILPIIFLICCFVIWANAQNFKIVSDKSKQRIDVTIDGKLFTSYRYAEQIRRPVLLPIMTANGTFVTRGFPHETRNGETINHPHQVGASFSYGDINGVDFWNTSKFRTTEELNRMGTIVHRKVLKTNDGKGKAELITESEWILPNGKTILFETTKYTFSANGKSRLIDRETTLTANDENVVFGDNKEGMFAIHLPRELQQNNQINVKVTDEKGNITEDKTGINLSGEYLNSEGLKGEKIWGTVAKWASVSGKIGNENVTIAVFDSPKNLNFPSYMMVRPYGLLALNPFGKKAFEPNAEARKFVLEPKKSIKFRHRLLIVSEKNSSETIEKEYQKFIN